MVFKPFEGPAKKRSAFAAYGSLSIVAMVIDCLEAAGVTFIDADETGGPGVRLREA